MSKRVSIVLPGEEEQTFALVSGEGSIKESSISGSAKGSLKSKSSSIKIAIKGSDRDGSISSGKGDSIKHSPKSSINGSIKDSSKGSVSGSIKGSNKGSSGNESAFVVPSSIDLEESVDDCKRYDKLCTCCHCQDMRLALKRVAFMKSPEGQRRRDMKMYAKNMFMDICAMSHVRKEILNRLHGKKELHPSPRTSYPVSITNVERLDLGSLVVDWYVHDGSDVDHYDIYVDNVFRKRIYDPARTTTVIVDVDVRRVQRVKMKAVANQGCCSLNNPIDKLVHDVCCNGMDNVMEGEYFCRCATENDSVKRFYRRNNCKSMVNFWCDSEFLYMPTCTCPGQCECDCYGFIDSNTSACAP